MANQHILSYVLIFLLLWDPAAVFIKKLSIYLSRNVAPTPPGELQVGSIIGRLERLIISILVLTDQLTAIGFVLTAKSLARFKQFEDQNFAEKYLVGTLASTALAIIIPMLLL